MKVIRFKQNIAYKN